MKKEDLEKIINDYEEKDVSNNIFCITKMTENSHSRFLAWLLKAKKETSIKYYFLKNFLIKICGINDEKQRNEIIEEIIANEDCIKTQHPSKNEHNKTNGYIDIFIQTSNFVCAIEVKLFAKINVTKNDEKLENQLMRYSDYLKNNFKNHKKKKIYLCTFSKKDLLQTVNDNSLNDIIKNTGFIVKEHSDVIIELYKTLKEYKTETNKETKKNEEFILKIIEQYKAFWEQEYTNIVEYNVEPKFLYDIIDEYIKENGIENIENIENYNKVEKIVENIKKRKH